MNEKSIILFLLIGLSFLAEAQDIKLIDLEYGHYPKTGIREATGNQEIVYREFAAAFRLPVVSKNRKTILINTLNYGLVRPEVVNAIVENAEGKLHYISYGITWVQILNDKYRLITTFTPAISSSLNQSLNADDFLFLGSAFFNKQVSKAFSWGLGIAYTSRFGEPIVIPMVQLKHNKNAFTLDVILPNKIEATWKTKNDRTQYGLRMRIRGSQFNLNADDANPADNIRFSRINMGPVLTHKIKGPIHISLFTGISVNRKHELITESLGDFDFSAENGPFVNCSLFISPEAKGKE